MRIIIILFVFFLSLAESKSQECTLSHDGAFNFPVGNNEVGGVWSAIVLFDASDFGLCNTDIPHQIKAIQIYVTSDKDSIEVFSVRVREGFTISSSAAGGFINNFGSKIYQAEIRDSLKNDEFTTHLLNGPVAFNTNKQYGIEVEIVPRPGKNTSLGVDFGPMIPGKGGWRIDLQHPNGQQLNFLDNMLVIDANWKIRAVIEPGTGTGMQNHIYGISDIIKAYPNPVNDLFNIEIDLSKPEFISVSIYDLHGKLIDEVIKNSSYSRGKHVISFDVQSLNSGLYICSVEASGKLSRFKVIVESSHFFEKLMIHKCEWIS